MHVYTSQMKGAISNLIISKPKPQREHFSEIILHFRESTFHLNTLHLKFIRKIQKPSAQTKREPK